MKRRAEQTLASAKPRKSARLQRKTQPPVVVATTASPSSSGPAGHILIAAHDGMPRKLRASFEQSETLATGGVYVGASHIHLPNDRRMLGLFAGRDFQEGEIITQYCPLNFRNASDCKRSHTARIPNSDELSDGSFLASLFDQDKAAQGEMALRTDVGPYWLNILQTSGIGYMANRPNTGMPVNAKRVAVHYPKDIRAAVLFLRATKAIKQHEEIITRYSQPNPT